LQLEAKSVPVLVVRPDGVGEDFVLVLERAQGRWTVVGVRYHDTVVRREFLESIIEVIQRSGRTVLISSHILTELSDFCNALGIMEKGVLVLVDPKGGKSKEQPLSFI
jgi:hypothetical protein